MSFLQTVALAPSPGLPLFPGLPLARLRVVAPRHMAFLNALAIGILLFLFVACVEHAVEPIEAAIAKDASALPLLLAVLVGGFGLGLMSLVYYMHRVSAGPGFGATQLAIVIATGIGLHNFSEGLAIGSSAQKGDLTLALTLVVGFGLHNVTEAFGIAGPLAGGRPSPALLGLVAALARRTTFLRTDLRYPSPSPPAP